MPPLEFHPLLKRARWGGRQLGRVLGKPIGQGTDYAESWEVCDLDDDQSRVVSGPYEGWPLRQLVRTKGPALLGMHDGLTQFPLLVKFLDVRDRLSLQVHPDDAQARREVPGASGKTEAWVILSAARGSRLFVGLKPGVGADELRDRLRDGTVERCLHQFEPSAGDCVFVPAGTLHAIGERVLLAEIQQPSDLTFRLHDWGHLDPDGQSRPLHVAQALDCIDFTRGPVDPVVPQRVADAEQPLEELVRCPYFVLRRHKMTRPLSLLPKNRFHLLIVLRGAVELASGPFRTHGRRGQTFLIPANADEVRITPVQRTVLLEAFLP